MTNQTIADVVKEHTAGSLVSGQIPRWPADVFCICSAILHRSGAYARVVDDNAPHLRGTTSAERASHLRDIGLRWRKAAISSVGLPAEVLKWWKTLAKYSARTLDTVATASECVVALVNLLAAADESFAGVGVFWPLDKNQTGDLFLQEAERQLLTTWSDGSSLCKQVHSSRGRVLPKMHTAQSGLTIRSMSHYIAYCPVAGVAPRWLSLGADTQHWALNLLIVPWPSQVKPSQFRESKRINLTDEIGKGAYGLFTFNSQNGPRTTDIRRLMSVAERDVGKIDGVIFPELSMSQQEFDRLARVVTPKRGFLVAGTGTGASKPNKCGKNQLIMHVQFPNSPYTARLVQQKHHRWKLNKSQIVQYGIGSALHPEANWWEHISLRQRELYLVTLRPWLTMSALICEDLARPDPVADLVRAIGPNLVICLLMDGPQLSQRWPGRYAGVLSDDPGSSVLTLTSLGMSTLSRSKERADRPNVIALWRDAINGTKELELPSDAQGLVLNLSVEYREEWTADGRGDEGISGYPVLTGAHPISWDA